MLVIDNYLKELVENNRRVIIPDLGAFLLKENENGTKTIIFSSFLRYNDGFLEESISGKANFKKADVSAAIKKFVNDVKKQLRNKKNYGIDGFGYFYIDEKGAVLFCPYNDTVNSEEPITIEVKPEEPATVDKIETIAEKEQPKDNAYNKQSVISPPPAPQASPIVNTPPVISEIGRASCRERV